jgi:hypothetical protein
MGLISVPGVSIPYPFGGKQRVVSVDLDPKAIVTGVIMRCSGNY